MEYISPCMSKTKKTVAVHVVGIPEDQYAKMVALAQRAGVGTKRSDVVRFFAIQGLQHYGEGSQEDTRLEAATA